MSARGRRPAKRTAARGRRFACNILPGSRRGLFVPFAHVKPSARLENAHQQNSRLRLQGTEPPNPTDRKRNTSPKRQTGSTTGRDVRITPITVEVLNWQTASKGILPRWPTAADRLTRRPNNLRHPHGIRRGQHHPAPPFSTAPRRRFQPPSTGVSVLPVVGCC